MQRSLYAVCQPHIKDCDMKQLFLIVATSIVLSSCEKSSEKEVTYQRYEMQAHPTWATERFKSEFDIQIPPGYQGEGIHGFEGNMYRRHHVADSTYLSYSYCDGLRCLDFNDQLDSPNQPTVTVVMLNSGTPLELNNRIEFTRNGQLQAILYHNSEGSLRGVLYMRSINSMFHEALNIFGRQENLDQIIEIIRTIKPR